MDVNIIGLTLSPTRAMRFTHPDRQEQIMRYAHLRLPTALAMAALGSSFLVAPQVTTLVAPTALAGAVASVSAEPDYQRGFRDGYRDGHRDGLHDAEKACKKRDRSDNKAQGDRDRGYADGYDRGYESGYDHNEKRFCKHRP